MIDSLSVRAWLIRRRAGRILAAFRYMQCQPLAHTVRGCTCVGYAMLTARFGQCIADRAVELAEHRASEIRRFPDMPDLSKLREFIDAERARFYSRLIGHTLPARALTLH